MLVVLKVFKITGMLVMESVSRRTWSHVVSCIPVSLTR